METAACLKYGLDVEAAPVVVTLFGKDSLESACAPAFYKLVEYLADTFPSCSVARTASVNKEEAWFALSAAVEVYFHVRRSCSLSEAVYGLKRVLVSSGLPVNTDGRRTLASVALCSLLPFLRVRFARQCKLWQIAYEDGFLGTHNDAWGVRAACVRSLRYLQACAELGRLAGYLLFIGGRKLTPSWALQLAGVTLVSAAPEEKAKTSAERGVFDTLLVAVGTALEFSALFVQFLDWWYTNASSTVVERKNLAAALNRRIPKPPHGALCGRVGGARSYAGVCPLCCEPWKVATALVPSGYVFCYACISGWLSATPKCPVSGCDADVSFLVRLYGST